MRRTPTTARTATAVAALAAASLTLAACSGGADAATEADLAHEQDGDIVVTYNSPAEWANFGEVLTEFSQFAGIEAPNDPKNSGQALAALQTEAASPVADVVYVGIAFADQLVDADLLQPYTPAGAEVLDEDNKSPEELWHVVHSGTVAFLVNTDALGDVPVPQSWEDLLDPQYEGLVGYLDPSQAAVGYSVATAANLALGGDLDNWEPGLEYLSDLADNGAVTPAQTATASLSQGEIPILIDADFNGYNLQEQGSNIEVVIPAEGSLEIPYVVGLVNGAPHPNNGKNLLDFYFSEDGQALFSQGFMRPAVGEFPEELADKVLPPEEYERAATVDYSRMGEVQEEFTGLYAQQVG
ncbi:extracellular solute-binding protein [Sediminivirga luteola]|uniref:ABC transporter substrate-binding protein n=1 Tax=Sediminivirga luteola TaxID=1774748 RepID=A0A8J2U128_9MICO|nr:extracellular solute-binding protein [Sediminivirga luteola]MCI2266090.1 extracellular solute-binding protein [Sediminivirga luteola]GGA27681.1 ABC transporter substrate-binding protein [Sediminivirga luteola]